MVVYVDDMYKYPVGRFGRMKMSHLMADSSEELLAMVVRIGVNPFWIQNEGDGPDREHFDISMSKRKLAIAHGAKQVTMRELAQRNIRLRSTIIDKES